VLLCCTLFYMNEQSKKPEPSLGEVYKLAKENNRMLHAMRRDAFVGGILKFVWWIALFIIIPYVIYTMYLKPYLENIQAAYQQLNDSAGTLSGAAKDVENLKNQFPDFGSFFNQLGGN